MASKIPIDKEQMEVFCRMTASLEDCAQFFKCSPDTIDNRCKEWGYASFSDFREQSMRFTRYELKRMLIERAKKSDVLLIFALKNLCGFSNNERPESSHANLKKKTFSQFCVDAMYPEPYPKQLEIKKFVIDGKGARLLLGSRGYGKTDYGTTLGVAFDIYDDYLTGNPEATWLIVTKSDLRNSNILREIANALTLNGIELEKSNSDSVRVKGLIGKDDSVSAITLKSGSKRGRHPKKIVMDDPVTEDDVSEATRLIAKRTYNELFKLTDNICLIGQPVHRLDLYEELRPIITKLEMPHGTIPELDHDLEAQKLAGVSDESISASYHLEVVSENSAPLAKVKLIDDFPKGETVAFIDPSFEGVDYTALSIARAHFSGVAFIGFCWKKPWDLCIQDIRKKLMEYSTKRVAFETNSLGDFPVRALRQELSGIGVIGRKTVTNKHSRILNAGMFSSSLFVSKKSDKIYIDQVRGYEFKSRHDDAPDSLASLLEWIGMIKGK